MIKRYVDVLILQVPDAGRLSGLHEEPGGGERDVQRPGQVGRDGHPQHRQQRQVLQ